MTNKTSYAQKKLDETFRHIERHYWDKSFTSYQLARTLGVSPDTARRRCISLYQDGLLEFLEVGYTSRINAVLWNIRIEVVK